MGDRDAKRTVPLFLKGWRKFRGMTQAALAEQVELSEAAISQLERGKQGFNSETLADLAHALGCTPADLLSFDPRRKDSFWPLLQAAEKLDGVHRQFAYRIMKSAVIRTSDGSE